MCGIAGFFTPTTKCVDNAYQIAKAMADNIAHRGPDGAGVWVDDACGVALAHRRLSVIDLSDAGQQPMTSSCGRYVMTFNGEIYNHLQIRHDIQARGHPVVWRGHSDTETLIESIAAFGIDQALRSTVGMFAFALWDRSERAIHLARDRIGEKPLYYGVEAGALLFASELKALSAFPHFSGEIDPQALAGFLRHNAVPSPTSIYKNFFKLAPGTSLRLTAGLIAAGNLPLPDVYWSLRDITIAGQSGHSFKGDVHAASDELDRLLRQAVASQMIADVPLGAFLSGGIDSSTIVALMQAQASAAVKTFSIGFREAGYNEADHARRVAGHLGTDHTEVFVSANDAQNVVPKLARIYDEPFADASEIPTVLVCELARRHVTVSLTGDGGDEFFGGYNRYVRAASIWRAFGWMPDSFRKALAALLNSVPATSWNSVVNALSSIVPQKWSYATPGEKLHKVAEVLSVKSPDEIYDRLISNWQSPELAVCYPAQALPLFPKSEGMGLRDLEHRMMYLDAVSYLPDDILVKVDRAAMSVALETRVPFLDHRVVEFAWRVPLHMKIKGGAGKLLVRNVLSRYVPRQLIDRPKSGFSVPISQWLRGALRDWADPLLEPSALAHNGYLNNIVIRQYWDEHQNRARDRSNQLWSVLMFQSWLRAENALRLKGR